ncbi:nudix hydrolase 15, mitochondrial-like isoform X2 [Iris pallida]|uniref:Nudix hydrolase 15, mitochondrial-like isoform X2 n=1 Tax=Iris pallida TaxID=29817 RepID=A0AAX6GSG1_IRIPA|nr:nudix hydrolase 15, mitochondrial-like isoform X2 [Iris pallida]
MASSSGLNKLIDRPPPPQARSSRQQCRKLGFEESRSPRLPLRGRRPPAPVILTKRSSTLHSLGEVALPGGKAEEGDADDKETALREAKEEIGLDPSLVTVVAVLEPFLSKHLIVVVPVIGILTNKEAFTPVANSAEVETVFDAPLEMFLKDENRRSEERERAGNKFLIQYFDMETEKRRFLIWGFTARILIHAASVVYQRPPSFPEQWPKFIIPSLS